MAFSTDHLVLEEQNRSNILTFLAGTLTTVKKMDTERDEQQASIKYMKECVKALVSTMFN